MLSESGKIVYRRFMGRMVESGLLIIAVALGVGAASSGFSLLANTMESGKKMLESVTYRELIVSTRSSADEMATPAIKKASSGNVVLTSADLSAASLFPSIKYAYVRNGDSITFINSATVQQAAQNQQNSQSGQNAPSGAQNQGAVFYGQQGVGGPNTQNGIPSTPNQMTEQDLKKAEAEGDIVVVNGINQVNGFTVTSQFFDAWKMKAIQGSLFSESDSNAGTGTNPVVLGNALAKKIAGNGAEISTIIGKKLLTRKGYMQVVGILEPTGQAAFDESFFSVYKNLSSGAGGTIRNANFNTQLRFTVSDAAKLGETEELISGWFASNFGENQVVISNPRSEAQKLINRNNGISLLILFLSASGLFIALVNVSHILMSRGLRMRKGVGIMMAIGASQSSVLKLFASEATAICVLGAILGGVFAFPLSTSMQSALGIKNGSWLYVGLGILVSWILTLAFSVVPAWQNSRIVPSEAMRAG
jgi:ABC-type antimicrobial peptide transport system permease subunit